MANQNEAGRGPASWRLLHFHHVESERDPYAGRKNEIAIRHQNRVARCSACAVECLKLEPEKSLSITGQSHSFQDESSVRIDCETAEFFQPGFQISGIYLLAW